MAKAKKVTNSSKKKPIEVALHSIDEVQELINEIKTTGKKLSSELF